MKQTAQFKSQFSLRNVSYNLLIGSHIINQQKPEVNILFSFLFFNQTGGIG